MDPQQETSEEPAWREASDAPGHVILSAAERRQLAALLARLPLLLTGGAAGRLTFLLNSGLGTAATPLPLEASAESFAGALLAWAEDADRPLDDPPGFHPLAAVCAGVLRLEDAPRDDRPFMAGLILKYALVEDEAYVAELRAEFGPPDTVTPWRIVRRVLPPAGTRYYAAPPAGLDPLPFTLRTAVRNFLANYLGTAEHPVPFGGRAADLARLEQWRAQSQRRCLLLATPAGRGKSALLARWADGLSRPEAVDAPAVVFVPVSSRFGTNRPELIFPCIAVQLAELLGEEMPANWGNVPPGFWQNLMGEYLRRPLPDGRPLLLIIDGLDEAAWEIGPDLLPHDLPPTTRVVVSARFLAGDAPGFAPWLGQLGWERLDLAEAMTLDRLSRAGVREALAGMGRPLDALAGGDDLIDRLYQLTEGDPLLVELYVDWLFERRATAARLRPEELDAIQPGYEGFFDHWWAAQEKLWRQAGDDPLARQAVRALLGILATALGPLSGDDVITLLPDETQPGRITLRRALAPLRRFIIGDGQTAGYALAHPRLGDYFREQFFEAREVKAWRQAFVDWVRRAVEERRAAGDGGAPLSPYLLQYTARHLALAGEPPERFLDLLLTDEWRRDWHRLSGTYTGFLRDVDVVLAQLVAADRAAIDRGELAPYLGYEVQCVLCHASVNALSANMPAELLVALRRFGGWTDEQVLAYARQKRDPEARARALIAVAPWLSADRQSESYWEALREVGAGANDWQQAEILSALAPYLPEAVYQAAGTLMNEGRAWVLIAVASYLSDVESEAALREALRASRALTNAWNRAEILAALTQNLPEEEQEPILREALDIAATISDERQRAKVLIALAPQLSPAIYMATGILPDEGWLSPLLTALSPHLAEEDREQAMQEALRAARGLEDEARRARVLSALAPYIPEEVYKAVGELVDEGQRGRVLIVLAPYLAKVDVQIALRAVDALTDNRFRTRVLIALAPYSWEVVYKEVGTLGEEMLQAEVLIALLPYLSRPDREEALGAVLQTTGVLADKGGQAQVLSALAAYLPQMVYDATGVLGGQWWRAEVLRALAPHLPETVYEAAVTLVDEGRRTRVLITLAPCLPKAVYEATLVLTDEGRRAEVLIVLASHLPEAVYEQARTLVEKERRALALIAVAPYLQEVEREAALHEALQIAGTLADESWRSQILYALAPQLPETVLKLATALVDEVQQANILTVLAPHLPEAVYKASEALADEEQRARVLISLIPYLQEVERAMAVEESLRIAETIGANWSKARLLRVLAPHLPDTVFVAAGALVHEWQRARVLIALGPYIPEGVYAAAANIADLWERTQVFTALSSYLSTIPPDNLYPRYKAITTVVRQLERSQALNAIAQLTPVIKTLGGDTALSQTLHAVQTIAAWWP